MFPVVRIQGRDIPVYGLCMAAGIVVSSAAALWRGKRRREDINDLIVVIACAVGCGLAGAKLLYIIASFGIGNAVECVLRGDLSFLRGSGLVFYGALLGGIAGALLGCRLMKRSPGSLCEIFVPVLPLGHAFGRLGCFFAGCCYGVAYNGPLAVTSQYAGGDVTLFPVQLLEMALNLVLFVFLWNYCRGKPKGMRALYVYLLLYAAQRFVLEFLRGDRIRGGIGALSTSQLISVVLALLSAALLVRGKKRLARQEGAL